MTYLLDTNHCSYVINGDPTANPDQTKPRFFVKAPRSGAFTKNLGLFSICCNFTDKLKFHSADTIGVSIITHAELLYMAEKSALKIQDLEAIHRFLAEVDLYFLDEETASIYSHLKAAVFNQ
jgi:tRNA(fMet)-specific endonuclease VapC